MSEAAENLDNVDSIITDNGGEWRESLAGENAEMMESLKGYDSQDKFLEDFSAMKNRDWRDEFAGDDSKFRTQLDRFKSPMDFTNSYRESQLKIRSGELDQKGFPSAPENATDDDLKAFREQHGIPLEPAGYFEGLPDNLVIGDEDREYFDDFANSLHEANLPPQAAHVAIGWYNDFKEKEQTALLEGDREHHKAMEDELRQDWGVDYRANVNLANALIKKTFGEEGSEALLNARDMDGRGIMNNKAVMEGLAQLARTVDPLSAIVNPGGDGPKQLGDEIAEIEKFMSTNRAEYNKDSKMQDRLRYLYDLRIKSEAK